MKRTELELKLLRDWTWFLEVCETLDDAILELDITQDEHDPEAWWTVKDHIAHSFKRLLTFSTLDAIKDWLAGGTALLLPTGGRLDFSDPSSIDFAEVMAGVNQSTHTGWTQFHDLSWDEVLAMGQKARAETLELLASLTDEQLERQIPGAAWGDGTIGGYITFDGEHQRTHIRWVLEALARGGRRASAGVAPA